MSLELKYTCDFCQTKTVVLLLSVEEPLPQILFRVLSYDVCPKCCAKAVELLKSAQLG